MKGLIFKLIIVLSIVVGAIHYSTYLATGKGLLSNMGFNVPALPNFSSIKIPDVNLPDIDMNMLSVSDFASKNEVPVKVYKWVDENGTVNYTQEKPNTVTVQADNIIELLVDPNVNIVQADKFPVLKADPEPLSELKPQNVNSVEHQGPLILPSPHNAQKLIEEAKSVQALMDARMKTLNAEVN